MDTIPDIPEPVCYGGCEQGGKDETHGWCNKLRYGQCTMLNCQINTTYSHAYLHILEKKVTLLLIFEHCNMMIYICISNHSH